MPLSFFEISIVSGVMLEHQAYEPKMDRDNDSYACEYEECINSVLMFKAIHDTPSTPDPNALINVWSNSD